MIPLLVKFPTRQRLTRFRAALQQYVANLKHPDRVHFLFSLDEDDGTFNESVIVDLCSGKVGYTVAYGTSESKIHAINRDINEFDKPWERILIASDDMLPCPMWDVWAEQSHAHFYPDGDGLLWFFDGYQKDICTIPLMGRTYYDRTGHIYDPRFRSVFADNLQTDVARALGRLTFQSHVLLRHAHNANDPTVQADDLHRRNETQAIWDQDQATYRAILAAGIPQLRTH